MDFRVVLSYGGVTKCSNTCKISSQKIDWFYDEVLGSESCDEDLFWGADVSGGMNDENVEEIIINCFDDDGSNPIDLEKMTSYLSSTLGVTLNPYSTWNTISSNCNEKTIN